MESLQRLLDTHLIIAKEHRQVRNLQTYQVKTSSLTDIDLVLKLKRGDQSASRGLFYRYYSDLCRFTNKFVRSKPDVEDIVIYVFEKLWLNKEKLDPNKSIKAYLYRAAKNRAFDFLKGKGNKVASTEEEGMEALSYSDPVLELINNDLADAIDRSVEKLPERCRLIFTLSWQENLTYVEIAEVLGLSEKTVENQISRAFKKLRKHLKQFVDH